MSADRWKLADRLLAVYLEAGRDSPRGAQARDGLIAVYEAGRERQQGSGRTLCTGAAFASGVGRAERAETRAEAAVAKLRALLSTDQLERLVQVVAEGVPVIELTEGQLRAWARGDLGLDPKGGSDA